MKRYLFVLLLLIAPAAFAQSAEDLFQQATQKERVDGDLQGAIALLERVVDTATDRGLAARALLRIGENYERLGRDNASEAYQRIVDQYADQAEALVSAKRRLVDLSIADQRSSQSESSIPKPFSQSYVELGNGTDWWGASMSSTGRFFAASDSGGVSVFDIKNGIRRTYGHPISGQNGYVQYVTFSPDESTLAIGQWEEGNTQSTYVRLVDLGSGEIRDILDVDDFFRDHLKIEGRAFDPYPLAWTADGDSVVTILRYNLRLPPAERSDSLFAWHSYLVTIPTDGGMSRIIAGPDVIGHWGYENGCLTKNDEFLMIEMGNTSEEERGWYVGMLDMKTGLLRPWRKRGGNHSLVGCFNESNEVVYSTTTGDYTLIRRGRLEVIDNQEGDETIYSFSDKDAHVGFSATGDLAIVDGANSNWRFDMAFASLDSRTAEWLGDMTTGTGRPVGTAAHWTSNGDGVGWLTREPGRTVFNYRSFDGSNTREIPLERHSTWFRWGPYGDTIILWQRDNDNDQWVIQTLAFPSMTSIDIASTKINSAYMLKEEAYVYRDAERNCLVKEMAKTGLVADFHCFKSDQISWGLQPNRDESEYLLGIVLPDSIRIVAALDPDGSNFRELGRFENNKETFPAGFSWIDDNSYVVSWHEKRWPRAIRRIERVDMNSGQRTPIAQSLVDQYDIQTIRLHPDLKSIAATLRPKRRAQFSNYLTVIHNVMARD